MAASASAPASSLHQALMGLVPYRGNFRLPVTASWAVSSSTARPQNPHFQYLKTLSPGLAGAASDLTPQCPLSVRKIIIAQEAARVRAEGFQPPHNIRISALFYATIGCALTLAVRIIRVAVRTLFLPVSLAMAAYQQSCYNPTNYSIVWADIQSVGWEWIDLANTLLFCLIGLINTIWPLAISIAYFRDYYIDRIDRANRQNAEFDRARKDYIRDQEAQQQVFADAQRVSVDYQPRTAN